MVEFLSNFPLSESFTTIMGYIYNFFQILRISFIAPINEIFSYTESFYNPFLDITVHGGFGFIYAYLEGFNFPLLSAGIELYLTCVDVFIGAVISPFLSLLNIPTSVPVYIVWLILIPTVVVVAGLIRFIWSFIVG